ncbi:MAG: class I adenylate-forming enzyme family protein, partial [Roseobacter sp.]|nr:class I adenylate-forming enzyme family protein [Roseobacter sp.]
MLSVFTDGTFPPCPAPFNLAEYVLSAGHKDSDKEALRILHADTIESWRYGDLKRAVLGTACGLLSHGLHAGDIVLLRLGNTVDFPLAYLGALAAGLVPVPTAAALTESETCKLIDILNPAAILRDPAVSCAPHNDIIPLADVRRWRNLPPVAFHMGDPDRLGYVVFTSGTSGLPRAVGHAHRAIWARQMMFDGWYGLGSSDRLLHAGA